MVTACSWVWMLPVAKVLAQGFSRCSFFTGGNGICVGRKLDPWDVVEMFRYLVL